MSFHFAHPSAPAALAARDALPAPSPRSRRDGWSPALQRRFLETLAITGSVRSAAAIVGKSHRAAYDLRHSASGAAFAAGWDAAILVARARVVDELMERAIYGQVDTVARDAQGDPTRHRFENRAALAMLARLDRQCDSPVEGTDHALARLIAQDFRAFLCMICPDEATEEDAETLAPPTDAAATDDAADPAHTTTHTAALLNPAAAVALFIAARSPAAIAAQSAEISGAGECEVCPDAASPALETAPLTHADRQERTRRDREAITAELGHHARPEAVEDALQLQVLDRVDEAPDAMARARALRGVWIGPDQVWRTDFPPPPGFSGPSSGAYDTGNYWRALSEAESSAYLLHRIARDMGDRAAAAQERDRYFGFHYTRDGAPVPDAEVVHHPAWPGHRAAAPTTDPARDPAPEPGSASAGPAMPGD
ncbi:MAG: hypothetical protein U5M50_07560 [Sphingobium sp.]|nr:hypothetical protein [Sphingobium sp.]